jgi:hypothetical protein
MLHWRGRRLSLAEETFMGLCESAGKSCRADFSHAFAFFDSRALTSRGKRDTTAGSSFTTLQGLRVRATEESRKDSCVFGQTARRRREHLVIPARRLSRQRHTKAGIAPLFQQ